MNRVWKTILLTGLVVVSLSVAVSAAPMLLTHQGRLTDATETPMTGSISMILRIYDASSGGSLIWSETHPSVSVTEGLFSVSMGLFTPLDADVFAPPSSGGLPPAERYLELEVGGEVISPRTRFVSSPHAITAHRVDGDLLTSPGTLRLGTSSETTGVMSAGSSEGTGYYFGHSQGANVGVGSLRVEPDSVTCLQGLDVDSDGLPEQEISTSVVPTKSQHAINTKGTGAQNGRVVAIKSETTVDSATQVIQVDDDGDGIAESMIIRVTNPDWADISMSAKSLGAPVRSSLSLNVAGQTQGSAFEQMCDLNDDGNPETSAQTLVTADSIIDYRDLDDDGDGVSEVEVRSHIVNGSFTGGPGNLALRLVDANGDGNPETSAQTLIMADSIIDHLDLDSDDDGISDAESLTRLLGHELTHAVQQSSGVGLNRVTMISETIADTGGVSQELGIKKGINAVNVSVSHRTLVTSQAMSSGMIGDFDDDGFPEQEVSSAIIPTKSQHAINTKGTGAQNGRVVSISSSTEVDSALSTISIDDDGDGAPEISEVKTASAGGTFTATCTVTDADGDTGQKVHTTNSGGTVQIWSGMSGSTTGTIRVAATPDSSVLVIGNNGTAGGTIRMQAGDPSSHAIELSGGAYCDGAAWVNASDAGAKENFQSVSGAELLEKLENLEITRWNYKGDAETEHIGPTAQDFQAAFGVGSDGKSISTIDPSGIALAAIKALNEKSKRVDELEKDVQELKRIVDQLMNRVK